MDVGIVGGTIKTDSAMPVIFPDIRPDESPEQPWG